jgi:hypothetical protein
MKLFLLIFICCAATTSSDAYAGCVELAGEISTASAQKTKDGQLLDANQKALNALNANDTTKRIKISSNIMILSARLETSQNTMLLKSQDCQKQGCPACPKI